MQSQPRYPALYQINTRAWLGHMSRQLGHPVTLDSVPDTEINEWANMGVDWIWLLSVWTTGEASRAVSRSHPQWQAEFHHTLPDLTEDDICGSGFAVADYTVSPALGGAEALARFRHRLAERGMRLMLDFVPNHTALDHSWVQEHPEFYVTGNEDSLRDAPGNYIELDVAGSKRIFAHGRDPYFPGWADTLQLDFANPTMQVALLGEMAAIASQCDGVRCDMAMLVLPEIFARTWGRQAAPFWPQAIAHIRAIYPHFVFMAEVYWELEWELQQQGFDYCYDKRLYDRLRGRNAGAVRDHLGAELDFQQKLVRFLENHDEPRAAMSFPDLMQEAAAVATYFAPGLRLFHQGQLTGATVHLSPHLCRWPQEPEVLETREFYRRLLAMLRRDIFRNGDWQRLTPEPAWDGNPTFGNFLAYWWESAGGGRVLVVINYAETQGQCRVSLPLPTVWGGNLTLTDIAGDEVYERNADELRSPGLYLDLAAWHYHVFCFWQWHDTRAWCRDQGKRNS